MQVATAAPQLYSNQPSSVHFTSVGLTRFSFSFSFSFSFIFIFSLKLLVLVKSEAMGLFDLSSTLANKLDRWMAELCPLNCFARLKTVM